MKNTTTHSQAFVKSIHDLPCKEIAKQIRKDLKSDLPKFKFSITSEYNKIDVNIISGPIEFYTDEYLEAEKNQDWEKQQELRHIHGQHVCGINGNYQRRTLYTEEGEIALAATKKIHNRYNHNNSEIMTDYFDYNYYGSAEISKWNKKYTKV